MTRSCLVSKAWRLPYNKLGTGRVSLDSKYCERLRNQHAFNKTCPSGFHVYWSNDHVKKRRRVTQLSGTRQKHVSRNQQELEKKIIKNKSRTDVEVCRHGEHPKIFASLEFQMERLQHVKKELLDAVIQQPMTRLPCESAAHRSSTFELGS